MKQWVVIRKAIDIFNRKIYLLVFMNNKLNGIYMLHTRSFAFCSYIVLFLHNRNIILLNFIILVKNLTQHTHLLWLRKQRKFYIYFKLTHKISHLQIPIHPPVFFIIPLFPCHFLSYTYKESGTSSVHSLSKPFINYSLPLTISHPNMKNRTYLWYGSPLMIRYPRYTCSSSITRISWWGNVILEKLKA